MQNQFREEIPVKVDNFTEWWTIGLDVDFGNVTPFISIGGVLEPSPPIRVLRAALAKWAEWLETL